MENNFNQTNTSKINLNETRKLEERKKDLLEAIEQTKKKKSQIIPLVHELVLQLRSGRITRQEHDEKISKALSGRSAEQWIKYYDEYISYYNYQIKLCERLISQEKYRGIKQNVNKFAVPVLKIFIVLVIIGIFVSFIFILGPVTLEGLGQIGEKVFSSFNQLMQGTTEKTQIVAPETSEITPAVGEGELSSIEPILPVNLEDKNVLIQGESLTQYQAVVGQPVKWKKKFITDSLTGFNTKLPENSENIVVKTNGEDITNSTNIKEEWIGKEINVELKKSMLTGNVISGKAVGDEQAGEGENYEIIYETPAPKLEEEILSNGKRILISGPDDVHYKNILSFANIEEISQEELNKFQLYQVVNGQNQAVKFTAYDTNENGLYDYIEWIIPELSFAEFLWIIEISKAELLDENKNFVEDIYEQVKAKDNNWFEVPSGDYIRVTFEQKLDNTKDITLYAKGNGNVEVYEINSNKKLIDFEINGEKEYKKFLTELEEGINQDVFDLRFLGNVEVDWIVDPLSMQGLVSWWEFDGNYEDSIGNNDGTAYGGANTNGNVLNLSGVDGYVLGLPKIQENSTISYWAKTGVGDGDTGSFNFASWNDDLNFFEFRAMIDPPSHYSIYNFWAYSCKGGDCSFEDGSRDDFSVGTSAGYDYRDNKWHHILITFENAIGKAYVDGVYIGQDSVKFPTWDTATNSITALGRSVNYNFDINPPLTYYFNGSIDNVMIFNRSLNPTEILEIYNSQFKDTIAPDINFTFPTPANGNVTTNNFIPINVSVSDVGKGENNISTFIDFNNSLLGWWRMDDVNSTGVYDNSSYNNFGKFMGGMSGTNSVDGKLGKAMGFDGIDDFINITHSDSLEFNQWTFSMWINQKFDNGIIVKRLINLPDGVYFGKYFQIRAINTLAVGFSNSSGGNNYVLGNSVIQLNRWYHVVGIFDGTNLSIYINGSLDATASQPYVPHSATNHPIYIGAFDTLSGLDYGFNGSIDDVMIFNRALSSEEIRGLYANSSSKYLFHNFTGLTDGNYTFKAYAQDTAGNVNWTEEREVKIKSETEVTECRDLTKANMVYTLQNSITTTGTCLTIGANNITLNGNGYTIDGDDTGTTDYGIYASGKTNLTIKNFANITDFYYGVYFVSTNNSIINNISSNSNKGDGIRLSSSSNNNNLTQTTTSSNTLYGIRLSSSSNNNLTQITSNSNTLAGVYLISSSNNNLTQITSNSNTESGILLDSISNNNNLNNITSNLNTQNGISLFSNSNNNLTQITANNNLHGISLFLSSNNNLTLITAISNVHNGIYLDLSSNNTLNNITSNSNYNNGILLVSSSNNNLTKVTFKLNLNGISLYSSNNNNLNNITLNSNYNNGIVLSSSSNNLLNNITANNNQYGIILLLSPDNNFKNIDFSKSGVQDVYVYDPSLSNCNNIFENITGSGGLPIEYYNSSVNLENRKFSQLILCNADNSNLKNITIESNDGISNNGLFMYYTDNSNFSNINSSNNYYGLYALISYNNQFINTSLRNSANPNPGGIPQDIYLTSLSGRNYFRGFYDINGYNIQSFLDFSNEYGEIISLNLLNVAGTKFYNSARINNNSAYIRLFAPANITLNNLPINFINPMIYNDNENSVCIGCSNFTSLNAGNVKFNVTTVGNYSIREVPDNHPRIVWVQNIANVTPNSGGVRNVNLNFTIQMSANPYYLTDEYVEFINSKTGVTRTSNSCSIIPEEVYQDLSNFSCTIGMWYFDEGGIWNITVHAIDNSGTNAINNSNSFKYEFLYAWNMVPNYVNWSNIQIGEDIDKPSDSNMTIRNLGNTNINTLIINASNLVNTTSTAGQIPANNFSFANSSYDSCNLLTGAKRLNESQNISINLFINYSKSSNYNFANNTIGFCLKGLPANLASQEYKTATGKDWNIDVIFGFFISMKYAVLLVGVVIRKKRKKKNNSLQLNYESLLSLDLLLKNKYKTSIRDLLKKSERKELKEINLEVPISIFRNKLSPAEALCKYLKENKNMRFSEIARLINRDERSIWTNYNNAVKKFAGKMKEKIKIKIADKSDRELLININLLSNRKLSILESVVKYLKEKGFRNYEIAKMIGKEQRNVYTLYDRAMKKMGG